MANKPQIRVFTEIIRFIIIWGCHYDTATVIEVNNNVGLCWKFIEVFLKSDKIG